MSYSDFPKVAWYELRCLHLVKHFEVIIFILYVYRYANLMPEIYATHYIWGNRTPYQGTKDMKATCEVNQIWCILVSLERDFLPSDINGKHIMAPTRANPRSETDQVCYPEWVRVYEHIILIVMSFGNNGVTVSFNSAMLDLIFVCKYEQIKVMIGHLIRKCIAAACG